MLSKDRKILSYNRYRTGYGTHHYDVKYQGEWDDWALINCIDLGITSPTEEEYQKYNKDCKLNWGGYVKKIYEDKETDMTRVDVGVNYD